MDLNLLIGVPGWVAHREYHPDEWQRAGTDACVTTIMDWASEARAADASLWCTLP